MTRWMKRIANWPMTQLMILMGMFLMVSTGSIAAMVVILAVLHSVSPSAEFTNIFREWLNGVLWFNGIAITGKGLKRATEKPELTLADPPALGTDLPAATAQVTQPQTVTAAAAHSYDPGA